jgi:hypothetical protein
VGGVVSPAGPAGDEHPMIDATARVAIITSNAYFLLFFFI